jgi:hypothetical protein
MSVLTILLVTLGVLGLCALVSLTVTAVLLVMDDLRDDEREWLDLRDDANLSPNRRPQP